MIEQARKFPAATAPTQTDGLMSPSGVYYPCGFSNHWECAEEIMGLGVDVLEEDGWLHISDGYIYRESEEVTPEQEKALRAMYLVDIHSYLAYNIASLIII